MKKLRTFLWKSTIKTLQDQQQPKILLIHSKPLLKPSTMLQTDIMKEAQLLNLIIPLTIHPKERTNWEAKRVQKLFRHSYARLKRPKAQISSKTKETEASISKSHNLRRLFQETTSISLHHKVQTDTDSIRNRKGAHSPREADPGALRPEKPARFVLTNRLKFFKKLFFFLLYKLIRKWRDISSLFLLFCFKT